MPLAKYPAINSGIFAVATGHWRIESELDCCKAIRANGPKKARYSRLLLVWITLPTFNRKTKRSVVDDSEFEKLLADISALTREQHQRLTEAMQRWTEARPVTDLANNRLDEVPVCPHCGSTRLQRWGRSGGLQRYRCSQCRKTFNPLTGTPLARLRKREQWPAFSETLADGATVQQAAEYCGVDPSTSFRWRHRFLDALHSGEAPILSGVVEATETRFTQADKGARDLKRRARRRGGHQHRGFSPPQQRVLLLLDRAGTGTELLLPAKGDGGLMFADGGLLAGDAVLYSSNDADLRRALTELGLEKQLMPAGTDGAGAENGDGNPAFNRDHLDTYVIELRTWMERFHGVNSRYLINYLRWCRLTLCEQSEISGGDLIARLFR